MVRGRHQREARGGCQPRAGGDIDPLGIDRHRHPLESGSLQRGAADGIARLLDPDRVASAGEGARRQIDALLRARYHEDLIGGAGDPAGGTQILRDRLAQFPFALGVAVPERIEWPLTMEARGDPRPVAPGKMVESGDARAQR